jgi:two-component system chemotaxis response regulator CheB
MFRSVAPAFGAGVLGVILTGMGSDGAKGARAVVEAGGAVIAQDEATSVVWGMPGAAAAAGVCSAVLPLPELSTYLRRVWGAVQ